MIKHYPHLETERDGAVLIIRLDNEAARNTLTREMRFSLRDVVRAAMSRNRCNKPQSLQ